MTYKTVRNALKQSQYNAANYYKITINSITHQIFKIIKLNILP